MRFWVAHASRDHGLFLTCEIRRVEQLFGKDCFGATPKPASETSALPGEPAQIVSCVRVFRRQRFDIADFHVNFLYAGPFCARAEEPAALSDDACSVERITRD